MMVVIVYVRANFILIVPTVFGILLAQHLLVFETRAAILKFAPVGLVAAAVFIVGLAPWSATLSSRMGGFYLTTTSIDLNMIITFAPPAMLDDVVSDKNRFLALHRHLRDEAERGGVSQAEAIRSARKRFLSQRAPVELGREIWGLSDAISLIEVTFCMGDQDFEGVRNVYTYDSRDGRTEFLPIKY